MINILCYGDSNTFGTDPVHGGRHPRHVRWTGRLQELLGSDYYVIEEGCGGRTTVFEDYLEPGRNGRTSLLPALTSHRPLDLVIIMLGTNDLKERFHITESDIQTAAEVLICDILQYPFAPKYKDPQILIMAPIHIKEGVSKTFGSFSETAVKRSHAFAQQQKQAAEKYHCLFFDAASVAAASDEDKLHMNRENHEKLAQALSVYIKEIFS